MKVGVLCAVAAAVDGHLQAAAEGALGVASAEELAYLSIDLEDLQSIKASDMTPMLQRIYNTPGGPECLDVLMKYL